MRNQLAAALLMLAAVGCGPTTTRSLPMVGGLVDTFEDGNLENALGHEWTAIAEGEQTRASLAVDPSGFLADSRFHLEISGVRPPGAAGSQVVGVRSSITALPPAADPSRDEIPRDVTGFEGLSLALRGTPGTYIVQLGTASVTDFDYYNAYVEVGETWAEYRLPFSAFRQEGFGTHRPWTGRDAVHIAVFANLDGYFMYGVDDVRFYQH